jgi:hypothetical protein
MIGCSSALMLRVITVVQERLALVYEVCYFSKECQHDRILIVWYAAGIPTIIHPFFGDQFFWADRVEALGVGSGVRKLTVDNLTEAFISATTDIKQIDRAKIVGEQIRAVSMTC